MLIRAIDPRGETPKDTTGWLRAASASATGYPKTSSCTWTRRRARAPQPLRLYVRPALFPPRATIDLRPYYRELCLPGGITYRGGDHKAVELALRQGVGDVELVWVLGRNDEERLRQSLRFTLDGHLPLSYRLQKGALGPGGGTVDPIRQQDGCEDRPRKPVKRVSLGSQMLVPVMSEGKKSGVNWIREKFAAIEEAIALASVVFPTPGTSVRSTCPPARSETKHRSTTLSLPTTALRTDARSRS